MQKGICMIKTYKIFMALVFILLLSQHAIADSLADPDIYFPSTFLDCGIETVGTVNLREGNWIGNTGRSSLIITRIVINGDSDFSLCNGEFQTVEPGEWGHFGIQFIPKSAGPRKATASIYSNDPDENPLIISIVGVGLMPVLSLSATTLDFGASINSLSFTISNAGDGYLVWNVAENPEKSWIISVTPGFGTNTSAYETKITVVVDRSQLSSDSDTGILTVQYNNGGVQNINVNIVKTDPSIVFNYEPGNPSEYRTFQNYPNPFNATTTIRFSLSKPGPASLNIYSVTGEMVKTLFDGFAQAGENQILFDAAGLPSGSYIYRLESDGKVETKEMSFIK
jgi:hypothetical protein